VEFAQEVPPEWQAKLAARNAARAAKEWAEADRLRDEITAAGFEIHDSPEGSVLKRKI
jgi:cysteinyl-tRNA synthetase